MMIAVFSRSLPRVVGLLSCLAVVAIGLIAAAQTAPTPAATTEKKPESAAEAAKTPSKFKDFNEVTKDAEKITGLFTLYRKDQNLYAEIKPDQMNQPYLAPMAIARGLASAGNTLNFG